MRKGEGAISKAVLRGFSSGFHPSFFLLLVRAFENFSCKFSRFVIQFLYGG